jgi:protein SCO1/2
MRNRVNSFSRLLAAICMVGGTVSASMASAAAADYKRSLHSYTVPDVTLVDSDAKPVKLRELFAAKDPVMVNFIFTSCGAICPVMSKIFSDVPGKLGADSSKLRMVSFSIDPEFDTPKELKAYGKTFKATERWKFLTGKVQDIKSVQVAFETYRGDKMSHEPLTLMRAAPGKQWVRIDGFASPEELVKEYRKALQE